MLETVAGPNHIYYENCEDRARPVVLIHGVGNDLSSWNQLLDVWHPKRPIIRYDLRGHGSSKAPNLEASSWSIDDFVSDHIAVLDQIGCSRAHTIGFSLGGLIAQAIAARYPDRVDHLVVIGSVAGRTAEEQRAALLRLKNITERGPVEVAAESVYRWYSATFVSQNPWIRDATLDRMGRLDAKAYSLAYRVLATTDLIEELPRITAPTLAITGDDDVGAPPRMARTIAATVKNGRFMTIPSCRHAVLTERAEELAKAIDPFVR